MTYYVNDKYPADHKNNRVQVIPLPINEIPEPYRKSIYDILCDRYSERTMNRLFHYEIIEKEAEEETMKNNKEMCIPKGIYISLFFVPGKGPSKANSLSS